MWEVCDCDGDLVDGGNSMHEIGGGLGWRKEMLMFR